jgi:hypothetical protein
MGSNEDAIPDKSLSGILGPTSAGDIGERSPPLPERSTTRDVIINLQEGDKAVDRTAGNIRRFRPGRDGKPTDRFRLDAPLELANTVEYREDDDVYLVGHLDIEANRFGARDLIELAAIADPMFCSRQINLVMLGAGDLNYAQEFATILESLGYRGTVYAHQPSEKPIKTDERFHLDGGYGAMTRRVRVGSPVAVPAEKVPADELWRRERERRRTVGPERHFALAANKMESVEAVKPRNEPDFRQSILDDQKRVSEERRLQQARERSRYLAERFPAPPANEASVDFRQHLRDQHKLREERNPNSWRNTWGCPEWVNERIKSRFGLV